MENDSGKYEFLPQKVYELLRWVVVILLPAAGWAFAGLNNTWSWGLPAESVQTTLDIVGTLLGAFFLGSKYLTDFKNK